MPSLKWNEGHQKQWFDFKAHLVVMLFQNLIVDLYRCLFLVRLFILVNTMPVKDNYSKANHIECLHKVIRCSRLLKVSHVRDGVCSLQRSLPWHAQHADSDRGGHLPGGDSSGQGSVCGFASNYDTNTSKGHAQAVSERYFRASWPVRNLQACVGSGARHGGARVGRETKNHFICILYSLGCV